MVTALLLFFILQIAPPLVEEIIIPGVNVSAGLLLRIATAMGIIIFLTRALSDALALADIGTDIIVALLGVKEERSLRRAARDAIYIILAILLTEAALPILHAVPRIGGLLTTAVSLIALAIVIVLTYDIGRILYRVLEEKAEVFADWLAELAERVRERKRM